MGRGPNPGRIFIGTWRRVPKKALLLDVRQINLSYEREKHEG
jgi:hypothetical protein